MSDEIGYLQRLRDSARAGETFDMLQNLKAETDPGLLVKERLKDLGRKEQEALKTKLEKMKGSNPDEPMWEPRVHWPLLQELYRLLKEE